LTSYFSENEPLLEVLLTNSKTLSQIEHIRHRSQVNAYINIIAGLIAYCHQPKKPSLNIISNCFLLLAA